MPSARGRVVAPNASPRRDRTKRSAFEGEDFEVHRTEALTRSATVLDARHEPQHALRGYF